MHRSRRLPVLPGLQRRALLLLCGHGLMCWIIHPYVATSAPVTAAAKLRILQPRERFLLPLLQNGPNNQVAQLKQAMAIAHQLNRTLILTGIFEHYSDAQEAVYTFYPTETLFDLQEMRKALRVASVSEARARGWSGAVDLGLLYRLNHTQTMYIKRETYISRLEAAVHISTQATKAQELGFNGSICTAKGLKQLSKEVKKNGTLLLYPFVMHKQMAEYEGLCNTSFAAINQALRSAKALRDMSRQYIRDELGNQPFIAAHVRPYPDTCLELWAQPGELTRAQLSTPTCSNGELLFDLAGRLMHVMQLHGVRSLFIMSHPRIRTRLDALLSKVNVTPVYMRPEAAAFEALTRAMPHRAKHRSNTLLLFAEQEVAMRAAAFVGSEHSSATWTTVHARAAEAQRVGSVEPPLYFFNATVKRSKMKPPKPQRGHDPQATGGAAGAPAAAATHEWPGDLLGMLIEGQDW